VSWGRNRLLRIRASPILSARSVNGSTFPKRSRKEVRMPLKDLSGKTVFDLEQEDFEKLFCCHCREYKSCDRSAQKIAGCRAFVDTGAWDTFYRKRKE
jgi:hypothetical protein